MPMPFEDQEFTFQNPDGTIFNVRGSGNQYFAHFETEEGYTVVKDEPSGEWRFAEPSADGQRLQASALAPGRDEPGRSALAPHLQVSRQAAKAEAAHAHLLSGRRRWEERAAERHMVLRSISPETMGPSAAPPPGATVGTYVGLCILIEFPDVPGTIAQSEVENFCNQVGYSGFGNNGSVRDYFFDVSDNKLTYTNLVTHYYTAANNRAHYTDPTIAYGTRARELITEALDDLVASGFNFNSLSADGANYIYALNIFYAGPVVNNWSEGLWPHSWSLATPYNLANGRRFFDYQFTNMGNSLTLGTFCHENGHMICDFPDLYDYGSESRGTGRFSLMSSSGNPTNPVQVDAYLKHAAGWTSSITTLTPGMTASVTAGQNDFYIFSRSNTEYFIIENRQQTGRDVALPDTGLAIWHVEENGSNNNEQMTSAMHYELSLEQADGQFHLENDTNSGDSGDLFASPGATTFSDTTTPNARWWDGSSSGLDIQNVSASGNTMTFTVGGAPASKSVSLAGVYELLLHT
jgi:M6 family metalloprotease-like protein